MNNTTTNDVNETAAKNYAITKAIMAHRAAGKTVPEAIDAVFGEGSFLKIAGDIYDTLRASA